MAYTVQRKDRFYVVAYDGIDPITGKERRRWHPVGHDRDEADALAARLDADHVNAAPSRGRPVRYGSFLTSTWLPLKRRHLRPPCGTPGMSTTTSSRPSATSRCAACVPTTSTRSTPTCRLGADGPAPA